MKKISKILSIVLCLAMVMGLVVVASAAPVIANGTYIIADMDENNVLVAGKCPSESKDFGYLYDDYTAEEKHERTIYKFTNVSGNKYTIQDCYGRFLGVDGTYKSFQVYATNQGDSCLWNITASGSEYVIENVSNSRKIDFSASYNSFGVYLSDELPEDGKVSLVKADATTPSTPPETPDAEFTKTSIANGEYVIYAPAHNIALSSEKVSTHYNLGVEVSTENGKLTGYGATEKWTVTNNSDGTICISQNGVNLAMADSFSSMSSGAANDKWEVYSAGNGLVYVKNVVRGNYIEWYAEKNNWSTFTAIQEGSEGLFALSFVSTSNAVVPDVPVETPTEPEVKTDPISAALAGADGTEFTVKGKVILIDGKNVYVKDSTGGICARAAENVEDLAIGDTVIATGSKSVYNGLPQLGNATYKKVSSGKISYKETTIAGLTTSDLCSYVKLSNVIVSEVYDNNGEYTLPNIKVTDGENEIQIYKAVVAKNEDGTWAVKVGDSIDVYGAVSCHNDILQLRNSDSSEIVPAGFAGPDFIGPDTGDTSIAGLVIAMMAAAAGCAVVIGKKKEF